MLANVLSAMPQLEKLEFVVPEYRSDLFKEAFHHANLAIPSVEVLIVGPYSEFMVNVCPNITTLSTTGRQWLGSDRMREFGRCRDHSMKLIEAVGAASRLRHFKMMEWWDIFLLEGSILCLLQDFVAKFTDIVQAFWKPHPISPALLWTAATIALH